MQTRLFACLGGGFLGAAVALPINSSLDLNPTIALPACTLTGVALGYIVSLLFDVFTASPGDRD